MPNRATRCSGRQGWQEEAQPSRAGGTMLIPTCLKSARSPVAPCTGRAPRSGARPAAEPPGRRAPTEGRLSACHAPHRKSPLQLPAGTAQGQGAAGERESCPGRTRPAPAAPAAASGAAPLPLPLHTPRDTRGPRHRVAAASPGRRYPAAAGGSGSGSAQSGVGPARAAAPQAQG